MKKFFCIGVIYVMCAHASIKASDTIEILGDIAQITPFALSASLYLYGDKKGMYENSLSAAVSVLLTYSIKLSFAAISQSNPSMRQISARPAPRDSRYDGFPSGHTSFVFSSVGFAAKRYGAKLALPLLALGSFTGYSRIHSNFHTLPQVLAGAALGFVSGYFLASKRIKSITFFPNIEADSISLMVARRF